MRPVQAKPSPSLHVLVVDDQPFAREAICRITSAFGHVVTSVDGGHAALDAVATSTFDVAVIDRRMPDMDGVALAVALRAMPCPPRLIALSGDDPADMLPGLFDAVLQKPVDARALARAVAGHLFPTRSEDLAEGGSGLASVFLRRKQG